MQRISGRLLARQGEITLRSASGQNGCVDARELLDLLRPTKNFIDRNESGTGHAERQQQYQAEAADELFANRKIGEEIQYWFHQKGFRKKGHNGKSAEITNS
ncbi:hypothetical protein PsSCT_35540 [Pseudomonas sp. SCT]